MTKKNKGFTLVELLVVVLILGILTSVFYPKYLHYVEVSKASTGAATGLMIYNAYAVYDIDHPAPANALSGRLTNACNTATCLDGSAAAGGVTDLSACRLVNCKYMASQDWNNMPYEYVLGNSGAAITVKSDREATANNPYNTWGYSFANSACTPDAPYPDQPECPAI